MSDSTGIAAALGKVGAPALSELTGKTWDAVLVGGGHNGLAAAAYLAQAGKSVLVLERRDQLGGACTLERPFEEQRYTVSPCAYVVGLLDRLVIDELDLVRHGYKVFVADPNLWCPFEDGTYLAQWADEEKTVASMRDNGFSDADIKGMFAYEDMFDRLRRALREGARDTWIGASRRLAELEAFVGHDPELISVLFEESIATTVRRYMSDERLHTGLYGQGVIGAWAGPEDPGTASIKLMHFAGTLEGEAAVWGYVQGGMGMVSFAIAEAAREAGAVLAAGVPVAEIRPGEGVVLEGGEVIRARSVISNADPRRLVGLCGDAVPSAYRERIDGWRMTSPVVKVNFGLDRLPRFSSVPDSYCPGGAMVATTTGSADAQASFEACTRGIPSPCFAELYFQTAYDPSVAPPGKHTMSVFCQYAPYELDEGTWDTRRNEVGNKVLDNIAKFAPDIHECVDFMEVLGPPDIEERIGLTGGHIFQGECLPDQMWEGRLTPRTPMDGVYLCGAATHPAGSVIAINGRNAAMAVIADLTD